jgi:transcriptional regulator with XRE-family HTH domain
MKKTIYSNENKILCTWLKEKRLKENLTIRGLAKKLDTAYSIVGKIEIGERKLSVIELIEYCEAINADPHLVIDLISKYLKQSKS